MNKNERKLAYERKMKKRRSVVMFTIFYASLAIGCVLALLQIWHIEKLTQNPVILPFDTIGKPIPISFFVIAILVVTVEATISMAEKYPR